MTYINYDSLGEFARFSRHISTTIS